MAVLFAYPSTPPHTQEISIRDPELGDARQLNLKTMIKQNMNGDLYTYKKTPTNSKFMLTFRTLTRTEKDALLDFFNQHSGHTIEYTDHLGTLWQCKIVSESLVITTIRDDCSYDAVLELITV